jgi:hypothetical protein
MRDWLLIAAPIAVVVYFMAYPRQFTAFTAWLARFIQ